MLSSYINLIISHDYPGFGGYGTFSYLLYSKLKTEDCKLLYICDDLCKMDKIKNLNDKNIHSIYLPNYMYLIKNINETTLNYFKKFIDSLYTLNYNNIFCLSPWSVKLAQDLFKYDNIYYFCCRIPLNINFLSENDNIWNLNEVNKKIILEDNYASQLFKENKKIQLISTSDLTTEVEIYYSKKFCYENIIQEFIGLTFDNFEKKIPSKIYDLIFITSSIRRKEKNFPLALEIFKKYPDYKKVIIGQDSTQYNNIPNTLVFENLTHEETKEYIYKSKILLLPSLLDASPLVFLESIQEKCIPLLSRNCGFYKLIKNLNKNLAVDTFKLNDWVNSINHIIKNYSYLQANYDNIFKPIYDKIKQSNKNFFSKIKKNDNIDKNFFF